MATKKRTAGHEKLAPDVRYNSLLASKFINCLMQDGKKATATRVFYDAMDQIKKRIPDADPIQVRPPRQQSLAIRWLLAAVRGKTGRPAYLRLADELMAAARREGEAMAKREQTIKMAEANKAFSHFAW